MGEEQTMSWMYTQGKTFIFDKASAELRFLHNVDSYSKMHFFNLTFLTPKFLYFHRSYVL